ncbi:DUF421 domain-containing protein [Hyphomonas sp.]|uniref:DUF421 domain-containing protein n=1 Tax=Hyphomonas sp. TaxID=87 RepID=UPI003918E382
MNLSEMFFQDWQAIIRIVLVGIMAYITLVLFLRISGKRTLAKLNAFDFVVTVALGSSLSAIMLQESITLADGAAALAVLILAQFVVTYASVRSDSFADLIRSEPSLLAHAGVFCTHTMRRERVTEDEALSAIRDHGGSDVTHVEHLFLESDGTLSVILRT